jgi:hypothetical protein
MKNLSWLPIGISGKDHGNKNGQKTTYSETTDNIFIQSLEYYYPSQTIAL